MYKMVEFASGFSVSIQAGSRNYSSPKTDNAESYESVELGFPSGPEPLIIGFAEDPDNPTGTVYGWVPAGVVQALIVKHGGIINGSCPPLQMNANQAGIMAESMAGT